MKTEFFTCDICGYQFTVKENNGAIPLGAKFTVRIAHGDYENIAFEHVCCDCEETISKAVRSTVQTLKTSRGPICGSS